MKIQEVISCILSKYKPILEANTFGVNDTSNIHLLKMCSTLEENMDTWPVDKSNRWVGYIQGVMCVYDVITTSEEREFTRPLFHAYYNSLNLSIPETVEVTVL